MTIPNDAVDAPLTPAQVQFLARVRWIMVASGAATVLGIAVVIGLVGYRVFRGEGRAAPDVTATLPKGSRVTQTAVAGDRIIITLDIGGALEIRTFDVQSLRPEGRLRFAVEP